MKYITYIYWRICRFNNEPPFGSTKMDKIISQVALYITGALLALSLLVASIISWATPYFLHLYIITASVLLYILLMIWVRRLLYNNDAYVVNRFVELDTLPNAVNKKYAMYYTVFRLGTIIVFVLSMFLIGKAK